MDNISQSKTEFNESAPKISPLQAGIFARHDLSQLNTDAGRGDLGEAARKLVDFANSEPQYGFGFSPGETRFCFGDFGNSALHYCTMFRVARKALDILEADLTQAATKEAKFHFTHAGIFASVEPKTEAEKVAAFYWQIQEILNQQGLSFDSLADYHARSDSEVMA